MNIIINLSDEMTGKNIKSLCRDLTELTFICKYNVEDVTIKLVDVDCTSLNKLSIVVNAYGITLENVNIIE